MWKFKFNLTDNVVKLNAVKLLSTTADDVLFQQINNAQKIGVMTLNRPKALNSLNLSMVSKIYAQLKKWQSEVSFVIIKGSGEKAFCAGADIRAIAEGVRNKDPKVDDYSRLEYTIEYLIGTYKIPYIALISGVTMGAGAGISVLGKYRIATEKTIFAMPETAIGLFPDSGASYFFSRLPDHYGMYYALTGHRLIGLDVLKSGLATHYCDFKKMGNLEQDLLNVPSITQIPQVLNKYSQESVKDKESSFSLENKNINSIFSACTVEEIIQNLKRENSKWSNEQAETLTKMCPTSLKVTNRLLRQATHWSLRECLKMDFRIVTRLCKERDFVEGVRAAVIDKDNVPKWNPPTLEAVSKEKVNSFFAPLSPDKELNL